MSQLKETIENTYVHYLQPHHAEPPKDEDEFDHRLVLVEAYTSESCVSKMMLNYACNTAEELQLVKKIDARILPALGITYALYSLTRAGMDTNEISNQSRDLYQENAKYAGMVWMTLISYTLAMMLSNYSLSKSRPSRYIAATLLFSGLFTATMAKSGSVHTFLYGRIITNLAEAAFVPAAIYLLSCWYKPIELAKRILMFPTISVLAQVVRDVAINYYGITSGGSISAWRSTFMTNGILTVVAALYTLVVLPDYPGTTRSFSRQERKLATSRILSVYDSGNLTYSGIEGLSLLQTIWAAMLDPRSLVAIVTATVATAAGTLSHLLTTSTIQTGYTALRAHRIAPAVYLSSITGVLIIANIARKTGWYDAIQHRATRTFSMIFSLAVALIGVVMVLAIPNAAAVVPKAISTVLFTTGIWAAINQSLTYVATTTSAPAEKRAVAIALVHSISGIGSVIGCHFSYYYLGRVGQRQVSSAVMAAMYMIFGIFALVIVMLVGALKRPYYAGTQAEQRLHEKRYYKGTELKEEIVYTTEDDTVTESSEKQEEYHDDWDV